jgi:hypothetical protein
VHLGVCRDCQEVTSGDCGKHDGLLHFGTLDTLRTLDTPHIVDGSRIATDAEVRELLERHIRESKELYEKLAKL